MSEPREFSRRVPLRSLDRNRPDRTPTEIVVEADPAERAALARRLGVPAVRALRCRFLLSGADAAGRVEADGELSATLIRDCVVSSEPFDDDTVEPFRIRFVPDALIEQRGDEALDLEAVDDVPYSGAAIDLGEAAVEQLALAMEPYPRRPGAETPAGVSSVDLPPADEAAADGTEAPDGAARPNPFAALAARRDTRH